MFIHAVPDNKGHKDGYYCTLAESKRIKGKPTHVILQSFGFIPRSRVPYLKAAFNSGNPETILQDAKRSLESKSNGDDSNG